MAQLIRTSTPGVSRAKRHRFEVRPTPIPFISTIHPLATELEPGTSRLVTKCCTAGDEGSIISLLQLMILITDRYQCLGRISWGQWFLEVKQQRARARYSVEEIQEQKKLINSEHYQKFPIQQD